MINKGPHHHSAHVSSVGILLLSICLFDLKQCFSNFSVDPNDVEVLLETQIAGPRPGSGAVVPGLGIWLPDRLPGAARAAAASRTTALKGSQVAMDQQILLFHLGVCFFRVNIFRNSFIFTLLLRILLNWSRSSRNIVNQ